MPNLNRKALSEKEIRRYKFRVMKKKNAQNK